MQVSTVPEWIRAGATYAVTVSRREHWLYVPTVAELAILKSIYPNEWPLPPPWHRIEGELVAAGYSSASLEQQNASVLLALLQKITAQRSNDSRPPVGGQRTPPDQTPPPKVTEDTSPLSPSRVKATAAYEWAITHDYERQKMTVAELFNAIQNHPSNAREALPPNADFFAKYLRDAGIKRYEKSGKRRPSRSIRRREQL